MFPTIPAEHQSRDSASKRRESHCYGYHEPILQSGRACTHNKCTYNTTHARDTHTHTQAHVLSCTHTHTHTCTYMCTETQTPSQPIKCAGPLVIQYRNGPLVAVTHTAYQCRLHDSYHSATNYTAFLNYKLHL